MTSMRALQPVEWASSREDTCLSSSSGLSQEIVEVTKRDFLAVEGEEVANEEVARGVGVLEEEGEGGSCFRLAGRKESRVSLQSRRFSYQALGAVLFTDVTWGPELPP